MYIESKEHSTLNIDNFLGYNKDCNNDFTSNNKNQKKIKKPILKNLHLELNESPYFSRSKRVLEEENIFKEQDQLESNLDENSNNIYNMASDLINLEKLSIEKNDEFLFSPEIGKNLIDKIKISGIAKRRNSESVYEEEYIYTNKHNKNHYSALKKENEYLTNGKVLSNLNIKFTTNNNYDFNSNNEFANDNFKMFELQNNLLSKKRKVSQREFIPYSKRFSSHNGSSNCSVENIDLNNNYEDIRVTEDKSHINHSGQNNFHQMFFNNANNIIKNENDYDSDQVLTFLSNTNINNPYNGNKNNKNLKFNLNKITYHDNIYRNPEYNNIFSIHNLNFKLKPNLDDMFSCYKNNNNNNFRQINLCRIDSNHAVADNYNKDNWCTKINLDLSSSGIININNDSSYNNAQKNNDNNWQLNAAESDNKIKQKSCNSSSQMRISVFAENNLSKQTELQKEKDKESAAYNFIREIKQSNNRSKSANRHVVQLDSSKLLMLKKTDNVNNLITNDVEDQYFQSNADSFKMTDGSNLTGVNEFHKISLQEENFNNTRPKKNNINNNVANNNDENQFIEFIDNKEDLDNLNYFNNTNNRNNQDITMRSKKSLLTAASNKNINNLKKNSNKAIEAMEVDDDEIAYAIKKQSTQVKILLENNDFDFNFNNFNIHSNISFEEVNKKTGSNNKNTNAAEATADIRNTHKQKSFNLEMLSNSKSKLEDEFSTNKGNFMKDYNVILPATLSSSTEGIKRKNLNCRLKPKFYSPNFYDCISTSIPNYYKNLINDKSNYE